MDVPRFEHPPQEADIYCPCCGKPLELHLVVSVDADGNLSVGINGIDHVKEA